MPFGCLLILFFGELECFALDIKREFTTKKGIEYSEYALRKSQSFALCFKHRFIPFPGIRIRYATNLYPGQSNLKVITTDSIKSEPCILNEFCLASKMKWCWRTVFSVFIIEGTEQSWKIRNIIAFSLHHSSHFHCFCFSHRSINISRRHTLKHLFRLSH